MNNRLQPKKRRRKRLLRQDSDALADLVE